jgi:hypothetical protein
MKKTKNVKKTSDFYKRQYMCDYTQLQKPALRRPTTNGSWVMENAVIHVEKSAINISQAAVVGHASRVGFLTVIYNDQDS